MPPQIRHLTGPSALPLARYADEAAAFAARGAAQWDRIERLIATTDAAGPQPLWEGYSRLAGYGAGQQRSMQDVRSGKETCLFFAWLAQSLAPESLVEIGTAFGASAMYWLAGLEAAGEGQLYAFEPNAVWARMAEQNMAQISTRYVLTTGMFEAYCARIATPPQLALIDGIHTPDVVRAQLGLLRQIAAPGAVVILDDINFNNDMKAYWRRLIRQTYVRASWRFGARTGIIELA